MKIFTFFCCLCLAGWFFTTEPNGSSPSQPVPSTPGFDKDKSPLLPSYEAPPIELGTGNPKNNLSRQLDEWLNPCNDFAEKLLLACDYPSVRNAAAGIIRPENTGELNFGMVCDLNDFLNAAWEFVPDPRGDDTPYPASTSFRLLRGDCDDYAVLAASMLWSLSAEVRIYCGTDQNSGHCFAEINLGHTDMKAVGIYLREIGRAHV